MRDAFRTDEKTAMREVYAPGGKLGKKFERRAVRT